MVLMVVTLLCVVLVLLFVYEDMVVQWAAATTVYSRRVPLLCLRTLCEMLADLRLI